MIGDEWSQADRRKRSIVFDPGEAAYVIRRALERRLLHPLCRAYLRCCCVLTPERTRRRSRN